MKKLIGTGVALVTPFKEDLSIDINALKKIVNYNIYNGIDYLVVLGTTAESATLTKQEKEVVIKTVVSVNNGRLPLVLGIGGNDTNAVMNEINNTDLTNFSAILSVSPFYNKPTQEGIFQHFSAISKISSKPLIIYNVPGRTSSNIAPETVNKLARNFTNIVAIKEAAGDLVQAMKLIEICPKEFLVISGDDMITLPMILAGGSGVISVIGEGFPYQFSQMVNFGLKKEVDKAYKIHYQLSPIIDYIFEEGNPAGIKAVFKKIGLCEEFLRLPLVSVTSQLREKIESFVSNLKINR